MKSLFSDSHHFCLSWWIFVYIKLSSFNLLHMYVGQMSRVLANGPGGQGSGWIIPKTQKIILDAALLNTPLYKVRNKGKVEQSREKSGVLQYTVV